MSITRRKPTLNRVDESRFDGDLPTIDGRRYLSKAAAAHAYGVSRATVAEAVARGELLARVKGKAHVIAVEDLETYFKTAWEPNVPETSDLDRRQQQVPA